MKTLIYLVFGLIAIFYLGPTSAFGEVSDHVLNIELSTTYYYDTEGNTPILYEFDACIRVDGTVVSGSLQTPDSNHYSSRSLSE